MIENDGVGEARLRGAEELLRRRELGAAIREFDEAEASGSAADRYAAGRWTGHMLAGDFKAAWRENDAIRRRGAPDPNRFWEGEEIRGQRVILRCLHGLGDAAQFLRYAPLLREGAAKLIVEVPPAMLELARCFDGVSEVITWGEQAPEVALAWDVQIEVIELPYVFRTEVKELPLVTNYLRVPPAVLANAKQEIDATRNLRIGLVWSSGEWNPSRSVPLELLQPLIETRGCEFWNLQGGCTRRQWDRLEAGGKLHAADSCAGSLLHLAAFIAQLDLIITPDTLAAHLAGAMGTPAWVMLEHAADWRWMHGREDSPWYPSLRLFRQGVERDWRLVIEQMQHALERCVASNAERRLIA